MFRINTKEKTITFIDPRPPVFNKKELPISIITGYRKVKIPPRRKKLNRAFSTGHALLVLVILLMIFRINISVQLFLATYTTGAALFIAKTIDDKKIIENDHEHGEEHIVIETEIGDYLVDCGAECEKLEAFLDALLGRR